MDLVVVLDQRGGISLDVVFGFLQLPKVVACGGSGGIGEDRSSLLPGQCVEQSSSIVFGLDSAPRGKETVDELLYTYIWIYLSLFCITQKK